jgi:hypothetical protein
VLRPAKRWLIELRTAILVSACEGLEFLGIALEDGRNVASDLFISAAVIATMVRGKRIGEETVIASEAIRLGVTWS